MDDNADRFGRKKIKSDAAKRAFAVGGWPTPFTVPADG
jgi:hypothetical protein